MSKYQLADPVNGTFGETYDTLEAAEAALDELVSELLETAKEEVKLEEEEVAARRCREPQDFDDEELTELAEDRIRNFHSIEEVGEE